jgi:transposase-like protein
MAGTKGMKHYPLELKLQVVEDYQAGYGSQKEIAEKYQIKVGRVKAWVKIYRREGISGFQKPIGHPRKEYLSSEEKLKRLQIENELLKKVLSELHDIMPEKRNTGQSQNTEDNIPSS